MNSFDLTIHEALIADRLVKYTYYPINAPIFHIDEINSILMELLNEKEHKENISYIREAIVRFNIYSQLKQGEVDNAES